MHVPAKVTCALRFTLNHEFVHVEVFLDGLHLVT